MYASGLLTDTDSRCYVAGFRPSRATAPSGPPTIPLASYSACTIRAPGGLPRSFAPNSASAAARAAHVAPRASASVRVAPIRLSTTAAVANSDAKTHLAGAVLYDATGPGRKP